MWWLITRNTVSGVRVYTVGYRGERVLPVFSGEKEARIFLWSDAPASGWRVRESSTGELISMLFGPCAGVERVSLDPSPRILAASAVGLVSVSRDRFLDLLDERSAPRGPDRLPGDGHRSDG